MTSLLAATDLRGGYGGNDILNGVSIAIDAESIGVIVGPNGAGKSTTLKALFGLVHLREGEVLFSGHQITNKAPDSLPHLGMAYVPQEQNIFQTMSVHENLEMGAYIRRDDFSRRIAEIYEMFPPLRDKRSQPAGELSGGQRQMVAIGRALMIEPSLILLDEPTAGLSPLYTSEIFDMIKRVNATGVAILMVEQNAKAALAIADQGFVLASGQNRYTDTGAALLADPEVAKSFLGD